ncbi:MULTISPECIES: hypothetical protein [Actinomycetes]|uniref:hypothetical protein n=1 Tax=Actinomycetes TaxID=1760 RepID=UPI0002D9B622|nr:MULTISPECIES: hypothetical protein [Actinomycetes]
MTSSKRAVYVVHDRTTSAQPGILATAYESVEKAIADLDGFRAQHPDDPGPLTWSTGPGWAAGRDAAGNTVFDVFGVSVAPDNEPAYFEKFNRRP